jgi:hypothetical protein
MSTSEATQLTSASSPKNAQGKDETLKGLQKQAATGNQNYKGFVAGVFSGIAKLSGRSIVPISLVLFFFFTIGAAVSVTKGGSKHVIPYTSSP